MTKTTKSFMNLSVITLVVFGTIIPFIISGCSVSSPLFSKRNDKASMIIEKPPVRIMISGEYSKINTDDVIKVLRELRKSEYKPYKFGDTIKIDSDHVVSSQETIIYGDKNKNKK